jgi:hypothetical protein
MKLPLETWLHWKFHCAAGRCDADARSCLWQLGNQWLRLLASKNPWAKQWLKSEEIAETLPAGRAWSLYETYMLTGRADGTPFWKDHMFLKILQDASISTDERRAAALSAYGFRSFQSALNRYLDKETHKLVTVRGGRVLYGDEPAREGQAPGGRTLFELMPSELAPVADQVFLREIKALCEGKLLPPLFMELPVHSKFALAASYSEITLNDPALLAGDLQKVHGCTTDSRLYHAKDAAVRAVAALAKKTFPPPPVPESAQDHRLHQPQDHEFLAITLMEMLTEKCFFWARSENWSKGLF